MTLKFFAGLLSPHGGLSGVLSTGYATIEQARRDATGKMSNNLKADKVGIFRLVEVGERQASPINYKATGPEIDPTSIKTGVDEIDKNTDHSQRSHDQESFKNNGGNPIDNLTDRF